MKRANFISKLLIAFVFILFFSGIYAAALFDPSNPPPGYVGGLALSTSDLEYRDATDPKPNPGGGKAYRPWYEAGSFQGDLIEYDIDTSGNLTTTVDFSVSPPIVPVGGNWSARALLDAMDWDLERKIITRNAAGAQVAFRWPALSNTQKTDLDPLTGFAALTSPVVDFLRGDRTNEKPGGTLRQRFSVMGDNIHTTPVYVAEPNRPYSFEKYLDFKVANTSRAARVYTSGNDGMVHAFDAVTGQEAYAYIPSMLIPRLNRLSNSPYVHGYFVDGQLTDADIQIADKSWKTILVGGLGAGGKGYFALDITNPELSAEAANTGNDAKILWEIDASTDDDLGYAYSRAAVGKFNDGKWYAAIGNGYNSVNGSAVLMLVDVIDGTVIRKINTGSGSAALPNGLSSPTLVDTNSDAIADAAYAGDIDGNLWKFDISAADSGLWKVAYGGDPLYAGASSQPITVQPDISSHPTGNGRMIYFGTGRLFTLPELNNTDIQAAFGIWDKDIVPVGQTLLTQTVTETSFTAPSGTKRIRTITNNPIDWSTHTGWTVPLPAGERILARARYRALRLQFISTNPTVDGGENWLMEPSRENGGEPTVVVFNLNEDGVLDANDKSGTDTPVGIYIGKGINSQPVFAHVRQGVDTLFINNLSPPFNVTCSGVCIGGLAGGHMDVDTDSPAGKEIVYPAPPETSINFGPVGLGENTDGHEHEYDEDHGITYVDLIDIEPRRDASSLDVRTGTVITQDKKLNSVEEVNKPDGTVGPIPGDKPFIAVIANADLSPGGTIKIGNKEWNVQVYQDMMVAALKKGPPYLDEDGDSLEFTLDAIRATGDPLNNSNKFRISFDNQAIIEGGLMPTRASCPKGLQDPYSFDMTTGGHDWVEPSLNKHITKVPNGLANDPTPAVSGYRWRNGTLVLQLLDAKAFTLQDWVHMPTDQAGNVTGGVHAKAYSTPPTVSKPGKPGGATVEEGVSQIESGFLYEVFMYWHYGDLYEQYRVGKFAPCYGVGAAQWSSAVQIERSGLTGGEYLSIIGSLTNESQEVIDYANAIVAVEACLNDATCTAAELDVLLQTLADAIAVSPEFQNYVYFRSYAGKLIPDSLLLDIDKPLTGDPKANPKTPPGPIEDSTKVDNESLINGLNDSDGAHSWVDLTP